jgi:hypothetical protein
MRNRYHSDNGAECWRCSCTVYTYTVDDCVTFVAATCIACGGDNMFYTKAAFLDSASAVSEAHRRAAGVQL